jgi:hypothetical protein
MAFIDDLVGVARREWRRWGGPVEKLNGALLGFTDERMEAEHPFWTYVHEYWHSIGSSLDGRDSPAWSAAFISYCFREAGAGGKFPYHENHSIYVARIESGQFPGLSLEDPSKTSLQAGALLWASRSGQDCRAPPKNFADAQKEVRRINANKASRFCSHCDIVVDVRPGEVDVIGGNVKQAVTRTTYKLDASGKIKDGRRNFIGVVRNALQ